jgi:hypothetical protein
MQIFSSKLIAPLFLGVLLIPTIASAQTNVTTGLSASTAVTANSSNISVTITAAMKTAITRADNEIARRVTALNSLSARVQQMQKVTDQFKESLQTSIQGQVSGLNTLQVKIDADTDAKTLKADVQSITQSYRIFALILPQGRIAAAADREVTIVGMMTTLGTKLQTRIAAQQSSGTDIGALSNALSDLSAKLSDAQAQSQQSVTISATLVPDGGDKTKMTANTTVLKTAQADLQEAQKDLVAARKDIATIMTGLNVSATASTTVTTTP